MVFKGTWFKKFKNCEHNIKLELNMKNKIGKGQKKIFGKHYRVRIHTEDCSL